MGYAILWMVAGWSAVFRVILGKNSWAKTERLKENAAGIADEPEQEPAPAPQTTGGAS